MCWIIGAAIPVQLDTPCSLTAKASARDTSHIATDMGPGGRYAVSVRRIPSLAAADLSSERGLPSARSSRCKRTGDRSRHAGAAYKRLARFDAEGLCLACKIAPAARTPDLHCACRRRSRASAAAPATSSLWRIAQACGRSLATVSRYMVQAGLSRLKSLDPVEPIRRYERATPGELLHIDTKRLGRIHVLGDRITGDRAKTAIVASDGKPCTLAIYNSVLSPQFVGTKTAWVEASLEMSHAERIHPHQHDRAHGHGACGAHFDGQIALTSNSVVVARASSWHAKGRTRPALTLRRHWDRSQHGQQVARAVCAGIGSQGCMTSFDQGGRARSMTNEWQS